MAMTEEHRELCWRLLERADDARATRSGDENLMRLARQAIEALSGEPAKARPKPKDDARSQSLGVDDGAEQ